MKTLSSLLVCLSFCGAAFAQSPGPIKVGVCIDAARFEAARAAGFDYVEIGASRTAALTDEEFARLAEQVSKLAIPVEAANGFVPADIKLVGPEVDETRQLEYVARCLGRMKTLGVKVVVFGSGGARRVPDGFSPKEAFDQLVDFCRRIAPVAGENGITIAIEPLRRQETNIVNSAREGLALVKAVDRPEIKLLVDYYHMTAEAESPDIVLEAGQAVVHTHIANPQGRAYPLDAGESAYAAFFANLRKVGYTGRVSVEASTKSFETEAPQAIAVLRRLVAEAEPRPQARPARPAPAIGAKADYHVHVKGDLTLDAALRRSREDAITYGIVINGGLSFPISSDAGLGPFLAEMRDKPAFVAFQAEGREWVRLFTRPTLEKFDYVFTDAMTWTGDDGRRMRLWIKEDVGEIADPQKFMETLVSRATGIFANEPIDLYVNPTFLPAAIAADYDRLWTPGRMERIVDGLARNGIAMEINNRYRIPSAAFIRLAKRAGVKFACGTNNSSSADLGRNEYCARMIEECGLGTGDFWTPPAEGQKAVQRKPLARQ